MSASRPRERPPRRRARAASLALALWASLGAASLVLLSSCGGSSPEILMVEWRLELRPSAAGAYESLSVFASLSDDDGIEDVEELWVLNEAEALAWRLTNADWTRRTEGTDEWIGAAGLARHDYLPMPRGEYRLVALDAAGERVEKPFQVEGSFPGSPPPQAFVEKGAARAASAWPETLLLAYDGTGALVATAPSSPAAIGLPELFGAEAAARAAEVAAYGFDPIRKMGAYSWKKKTR